MHNRSDRFDLTLSLQEIVVLFFVMVALFTGLLFFGYRVGYMQNANAHELQSQPVTPAAPAGENPEVGQESPGEIKAEPEIRL